MGVQALCIHGHFYQPPREDPLSGEIPIEQGAAPYRNWNERIYDQCYRPNAELGNFAKLSFNIGPTLARWMSIAYPQTLAEIVAQDRINLKRYGVSNAMAQPYNHTILPLAQPHDRMTQVLWGIADYEFRFGHKPAGMWLPEAAVNQATLETLVECGIEFIILAPWQAKPAGVDGTRAYKVRTLKGKEISVFFYNQDLSTRVSFDPASTYNADTFLANVVLPKFKPASDDPQIVLIASDGELYGHHQPFRDKFLAYLMDGALVSQAIEPVFPSLWLKRYPARRSVEIAENSSWSCLHGVERWRGTCDCTPHGEWKTTLRRGLDQLAGAIDEEYLKAARPYLADPWKLRHAYIHVLLGQLKAEELIAEQFGRLPEEDDLRKICILLAAQYDRQRMFTSCGWFFDDFDRIEPRNNVAYASQAVWLTYLASGVDLTNQARAWLRPVKSRRSGLTAESIFLRHLTNAWNSKKAEFTGW